MRHQNKREWEEEMESHDKKVHNEDEKKSQNKSSPENSDSK